LLTRLSAESPAEPHAPISAAIADVYVHIADTPDKTADANTSVSAAAAAADTPPTPASPHFRVPLTDRFNYASMDCSVHVHTMHVAAKSACNILSSKQDRYMLSPCSTGAAGQPQFMVVELCEDIWIDTVQLANFKFF
jgi:Sad1 / UNC-like C-terminal